ncbi:glycosyltransferase family 4 protein [Salibacter sp.]|uniref:glycosyltransferase family 4 protein n=1 Tax=Salibacter sp. TaxID=2010995 RepID=UPI002870B058|nr:glycosyltransferase family 4 protein [Salibacter sp.]MDR9488499.1 glycosyltransferase family 4 protein [Salibacter sp.]
MKILILTQYYPPETGAPQNRLHELAVRLKNEGNHIEVLTAMPNYPKMEIFKEYIGLKSKREEIDGISVHRSSIYVSKDGGIIKRLLNYFSFVWSGWKYGTRNFKKNQFDFLLVESPPLFLGFTAVFLSRKLKTKMIFNVSDLWPESAEKLDLVKNKFFLNLAYKLEAWCYKNAALITGQTQGIVKDIDKRFPTLKTFWLPNGVDLSYYNPDQVQSNWRVENDYSDSDILLFYGGIIGHAQGLEVILKAAKEVQNHPELKFILMGDGPVKNELLELSKDMNLNNVRFFDPVPKSIMPKVVKAVDATIVPLRNLPLFEGAIPSKIFENAAMKNPVILGVKGEAKDLFADEGQCALPFEPENHQELASLLVKIANGQIQLKELGENGRNYVDQKFNRNKIAASFNNELKKLVSI